MTLPTKLTLLRVLLAFLVMSLLFIPGWPAKAAALACFFVAGATDWLDGYLARRWQQATPLGALLDPIADKVLVLGTFLAFVQLRLIPAWMVLVIVLRESLITGVRLVAAGRNIVLPAAREGKQKTVSQLVAIFVILLELLARAAGGRPALVDRLDGLRMASLWLTTLLTVSSGLTFFRTNRRVLLDAGLYRGSGA